MRVAAWREDFEEAQAVKTYLIGAREYPRVVYGDEGDCPETTADACPDCGVGQGFYHLVGCDLEECPRCAGRAIACVCPYADKPR
jgi:hypothetical protein